MENTMSKDIQDCLPELLQGEAMREALEGKPAFDPQIRNADMATRLLALNDIYNVFVPLATTGEIYTRMYLTVRRVLLHKQSSQMTRQSNRNGLAVRGMDVPMQHGIIGGADSYTIIGPSGSGKTTSIMRSIMAMEGNKVIRMGETSIIPVLSIQTPYDCSPKSTLLGILRGVDHSLGTNYYEESIRARSTTDILLYSVSNVLINHAGLLVLDEIQNVVQNRQGKALISLMTELINSSGICICMVGTPECKPFFESALQLARRSIGLECHTLSYGEEFETVCKELLRYQYVKEPTDMTDSLLRWLYDHTAGNISILVALLFGAQEESILSGKETMGVAELSAAYEGRLRMLHDYTEEKKPVKRKTVKSRESKKNAEQDEGEQKPVVTSGGESLESIVKNAKDHGRNPLLAIKSLVNVQEVAAI